MKAFEADEIRREREERKEAYHEFLRVPSMSCGVYHRGVGARDPQSPHSEDEVYVVLDGDATIRVGSEDRRIRAGSVVYVAAGVEHRFHSITEDLTVLVFFAPAEGLGRMGGATRSTALPS